MTRYYIQPIDPAELASRFSTEDTLDPIHGMSEEWILPRIDKIRSVLDRLPDRETDLIRLYFFMNKKQTDIAEIFGITQAAVSYRIKRALDRIKFLVDMPDLGKDQVYEILLEIMPTKMDAQIFAEMYDTTCQSEVAKVLKITQGRVRHRYLKNLTHFGEVLLDRFYSWTGNLDSGHYETQDIRQKLDVTFAGVQDKKDEDFENALLLFTYYLEDGQWDVQKDDLVQLASLYRVFVRIRYNFNILREVKLPKWSNRPTNTIA
jgi:predicted XRE-type DNA-binding protein